MNEESKLSFHCLTDPPTDGGDAALHTEMAYDMFDQFVVTPRCDQFRPHEHFRRTVYEATRVGLLSCSTIVERETKAAAPAATSALVRNPARR